MQQFYSSLVVLACLASPVCAQSILASDMPCGSSVHIGDIDLANPAQRQTESQADGEPGALIAFVPIQTPLTDTINAPTAFHGVAAIAAPGPGPADYKGECSPELLKPTP